MTVGIVATRRREGATTIGYSNGEHERFYVVPVDTAEEYVKIIRECPADTYVANDVNVARVIGALFDRPSVFTGDTLPLVDHDEILNRFRVICQTPGDILPLFLDKVCAVINDNHLTRWVEPSHAISIDDACALVQQADVKWELNRIAARTNLYKPPKNITDKSYRSRCI